MPYKDPQMRKDYLKSYNEKWYAENKKARIAQVRQRKKLIREKLNDYKRSSGCQRCSENHPRALDFHHVKGKKYLVSFMISEGFSVDSIMKEARKCILLCANCHRLEHYAEAQSSAMVMADEAAK